MTDQQPHIRIWVLLGAHRGDNNQVLALAEALKLPFEVKQLRYNRLRLLRPALLGATFRTIDALSRLMLEGDAPDLTISTGIRSVPVVRELKRRSNGRLKSVHLGYPRISPSHFDLVVPTPEYPVADAPNVLRIPFALSRHSAKRVSAPDCELLNALGRPLRLLVLGGPTRYWDLPIGGMLDALRRLLKDAESGGGSVVAVGSPRTPPDVLAAVRTEIERSRTPALLAPSEGPPSYAALIDAADLIFVTADSVAMVADAVTTGKPVGLVPVAASRVGRAAMRLLDRLNPGGQLRPRDLRFFWAALKEHGFAGTLENPRASMPADYGRIVANRVRQLLELPPLRARDAADSDP